MNIRVVTILGLLISAPPAHAGDKSATLLRAVAFILTGDDATSITVLDLEDCVFRIEVTGELQVAQIYHLNNVDVTRSKIRPIETTYKNNYRLPTYRVEITLLGEGTVYEIPKGADWKLGDQMMPGSPQYTSAKTVITLQTEEYARVLRAWKYIYSHGCKGHASSF